MPSSSLIWLLAGSVLCLTELFLPSAFVAFMMGISALIVGLLSYSGIGNLWIQVAVWLFLAGTTPKLQPITTQLQPNYNQATTNTPNLNPYTQ